MNNDPDFRVASEGIRHPHQVILEKDMWICRFASSKAADGALHHGPWWISSEDFRKLLFATEKSNFNYKFYARIWLAVKAEWSTMDRLIVAKVANPLKVWAGRGRTVKDSMPNGMTFVYKTPPDITQLYIPGMVKTDKDPKSGFNIQNVVVHSVNEVPPIRIPAMDG